MVEKGIAMDSPIVSFSKFPVWTSGPTPPSAAVRAVPAADSSPAAPVSEAMAKSVSVHDLPGKKKVIF